MGGAGGVGAGKASPGSGSTDIRINKEQPNQKQRQEISSGRSSRATAAPSSVGHGRCRWDGQAMTFHQRGRSAQSAPRVLEDLLSPSSSLSSSLSAVRTKRKLSPPPPGCCRWSCCQYPGSKIIESSRTDNFKDYKINWQYSTIAIYQKPRARRHERSPETLSQRSSPASSSSRSLSSTSYALRRGPRTLAAFFFQDRYHHIFNHFSFTFLIFSLTRRLEQNIFFKNFKKTLFVKRW